MTLTWKKTNKAQPYTWGFAACPERRRSGVYTAYNSDNQPVFRAENQGSRGYMDPADWRVFDMDGYVVVLMARTLKEAKAKAEEKFSKNYQSRG